MRELEPVVEDLDDASQLFQIGEGGRVDCCAVNEGTEPGVSFGCEVDEAD